MRVIFDKGDKSEMKVLVRQLQKLVPGIVIIEDETQRDDWCQRFEDTKGQTLCDKERLARAIENCQTYFWGNASYAVVYCVCRDDYKIIPNMSAFERNVEQLPYMRKRDYVCKKGTITNAFSDNKIYYSHVDKWEAEGTEERIIILRDELRKELAKGRVL